MRASLIRAWDLPLIDVDLILLSRDSTPPARTSWPESTRQQGVRIHLHRLAGTRYPDDPNRFATITRARNKGRRLGSAPYVFLLDDDVVLGPRFAARLVQGLTERSVFAALAADSAGEMARGMDHWDYPRHVGMAAVVWFRRERLRASHVPVGAGRLRMSMLLRRPPPRRLRHRLPPWRRSLAQTDAASEGRPSSGRARRFRRRFRPRSRLRRPAPAARIDGRARPGGSWRLSTASICGCSFAASLDRSARRVTPRRSRRSPPGSIRASGGDSPRRRGSSWRSSPTTAIRRSAAPQLPAHRRALAR